MDLKSTLNLPRTEFPMKARLPELEPKLLERWDDGQLYQKLREARRQAPVFLLHDGPPYANGEVHLGTALTKVLKDLIVRSRSLAGYNAPFIPGWDCHGLPIEINVDKELGARKAALSPLEVRRACRDYAARFVDLQRKTFVRLGCLGDWRNPYLTMSPEYEFVIADAFLTFLEKGYVYKGLRPVLWCWRDQTALAEAEIEYEMKTSPSLWARYPIAGGQLPNGFPAAAAFAIIWTTTPWTLPASMALAFHPQLRYALVERDTGDRYLIAEDLVARVAKETGWTFGKQVGTWAGSELAGLKFQHPFLERALPAVLADYVTLEQGSGIVHTAPGHGAEDFETGRKYNIDIYCPVDAAGRFTEGPFAGDTIWDANPKIIALLGERGNLVRGDGSLEHSYPHCWRCRQPLLFRATEQWFIRLEHNRLRARALEEIKKVKWIPAWGQERISDMIETRPDWCISRQRLWGVPIPVFYCEKCSEKFLDVPTLRTAVKYFKREGADAWFAHPAEELLPQGTRCESCGHTGFRKETDILDVWFDSGCSHLAVLTGGGSGERRWPADVYIEGLDQYRGWFHSSLLVAVGVKDAAPYRAVVTNAWVLDAQGRPMSKSLGNVIAPDEICAKYGADVLRLLIASVDYHGDLWVSSQLLEQAAEAYRKMRNTFRFALSNLYDFDPAKDGVAPAEMEELDRWLLGRAAELGAQCRAWYEAYEFHRVYHALYNFCTVELSALYFDILKDRLYTFAARSPARRSAQTALHRVAQALVRLAAPILPFTSEEIWRHLPGARAQAASVHLTEFPRPEELAAGLPAEKAATWEKLFAVRTEVLKALEQARQAKKIRSSLEARIYLRVSGDTLGPLLRDYRDTLRALFIVSAVEVGREARPGLLPADLPGLEVGVDVADGKKCERCWNYSPQVGTMKVHPAICERCAPVLESLGAGKN